MTLRTALWMLSLRIVVLEEWSATVLAQQTTVTADPDNPYRLIITYPHLLLPDFLADE
jgi:hypothetical protein